MKSLVITLFAASALAALAQHKGMESCPLMQADQHSHGVDSRGDKAMGFSHAKTQHHFRLFKNGGSIDVVVKEKGDGAQVDAVRSHLKMISGMFSHGDFHLPMFIHDRTVPGQKTMQTLRKNISYTYADLPEGGRVRIQTNSQRALGAIHDFLRFQVKDHRTGDSGKIEKP
jgi:hypothetical protein